MKSALFVVPKTGFRCSTALMGLILQGNSDARAVWHHKHPVSWIIALKSTSCVRALFKSGKSVREEFAVVDRMLAVPAVTRGRVVRSTLRNVSDTHPGLGDWHEC